MGTFVLRDFNASMREEHGNLKIIQYALRGASKDELPHPGMAKSPHDQQVRVQVAHMRLQDVRNGLSGAVQPGYSGRNVVIRKILGQPLTRTLVRQRFEMMWWTALFPNAGEKRWMSKTPPHGSQRWA